MLSAVLLAILIVVLFEVLAVWNDSQSGGAHPATVKLSRPE